MTDATAGATIVVEQRSTPVGSGCREKFSASGRDPRHWGSEYWWAPGDVLPNGPGGYGAVDELGLPKRHGLSQMQSELGLEKRSQRGR
jgi:hypothetical protein